MSLETQLQTTLNALLSRLDNSAISAEQIIQCLDLTILDQQASNAEIMALEKRAITHRVAAICVLPQHVSLINPEKINLATVVNFPQGTDSVEASMDEIRAAKSLAVSEIDYVFPYQAYLDGNEDRALDSCRCVQALCSEYNLTLKIILETGAFSKNNTLYELCRTLIDFDCSFLKTSTGKISKGASLDAAFTMLSAISDAGTTTGLKISGGVRTAEQALQYAQLAELMAHKPIDKNWFRIGASTLLDDLLL